MALFLRRAPPRSPLSSRGRPMNGVRIKPHRPLRSVLVVVLLVVVTGVAVYLHQQRAARALRTELESVSASHRQLRHDNRILARDNDELGRQLTVLTRTQQVERIAYDRIDDRLRVLQGTVHSLEEEVAFYRSIVAADREQGIEVRNLVVDPDGRERGYRFQVVLTRGGKSDKVAAGSVSLSVSGEHQGKSRRLSFRDLSMPKSDALEFSFKYLQRLQGHLTLPAGFVPRRVHVRVDTPDEKSSSLERHFDWPALAS